VSDESLRDLRIGARPAPKRSAAGGALRAVGLALLASLLFGFALGLWLRCEVERPKRYLGETPRSGPTLTRVAV
jgi:hypothetical protein